MKQQLFDLLVEKQSLSEFVDSVGKLLHIPFWVMDDSFEIIACTHNPSTLPYEQKLFQDNTSAAKALHWIQSGISGEITETQNPIHRIDAELETSVVLFDIVYHHKLLGRLTFFQAEDDLKDEIVILIAQACAVYIRNENMNVVSNLKDNFLLFLLENRLDEKEINDFKNSVQWEHTGPYSLVVLDHDLPDTEKTGYFKSWIRHFHNAYPDSLSIVWHNRIFILLSKKNLSSFIHDIHDLKAGISLPFNNLMDIQSAIEQSLYALQKGKHTINMFQNVYNDYFMDILKANIHSDSFILPEVMDMIDYDKEYNTHYLETLETYFASGESKEKTAKALNIHINSVKYRLQQMQKLFCINPEENRAAILLSISIYKNL